MRLNSSLFSLCLLALAACGGGGSSSSGGSSANTTTPPPALSGNMIFIGDKLSYSMAAVDTLTPQPGNVTAKLFTTGTQIWDAAFDGNHDELYVAASSQVDVYSGASKLDGTIKPTRTIVPVINGLLFVQRVFLDKANDRLYLGVKAAFNGSVAVFEQASKLSGSVAPSRIISGQILGSNFTLDLKRNLLYTSWCCSSPQEILVFEHIDTAKGETPIARRISIRDSVSSLAMDSSRDRLYITGAGPGRINILDGASTASGSAPVTSLSLPTPKSGFAITIDAANDRLYAGFGSQAFVLNDASKLSDGSATAQAAAIVGPANTLISYFAVPQ